MNRPRWTLTCCSVLTALLITVAITADQVTAATASDPYCAVYLPPHKITQRTLDEIRHYAGLTPINAVVLHVKSPRGKLIWPAQTPLAVELGVTSRSNHLERHIRRLSRDGIHTIAKLDVFADHRLATQKPVLGVMDLTSGMPWTDANGLAWSNPADSRVWDYNIALAMELAELGVDEIQFDYVRFPSDGNLSAIHYPNTADGFSKADVIAAFLERAHNALKPYGVILSADVFGLTAWKTDDFGVGQVLEKMAPHLDVICPMFYPSHFPTGFLGKQSPGDFPEMIMAASVRSMMRRTQKPVRPWVQGFWYGPQQIVDQLDGIANADCGSWSIWSPTGRYGVSYRALAMRAGTTFSKPRFYPTVAELRGHDERMTHGHSIIVNFTDYAGGYSILSLEASSKTAASRYTSPAAILATLDEGIMDHILARRLEEFDPDAEPYTKRSRLSGLLCADLGKDPRRMRPEPIYIDWAGDCVFTSREIPGHRLELYAQAGRTVVAGTSASDSAANRIRIAALNERMMEETAVDGIQPPVILSR